MSRQPSRPSNFAQRREVDGHAPKSARGVIAMEQPMSTSGATEWMSAEHSMGVRTSCRAPLASLPPPSLLRLGAGPCFWLRSSVFFF